MTGVILTHCPGQEKQVIVKMNKKQAIEELHTIKDFIRWGFSQLSQADVYYGHGTDNALDEIFALVLHALQLPHDFPESYLDSRLTTDERIKIGDWIERRIKKRIPTAYLTHEAWFAHLPFYVDERVLIPRSPLAELIEAEFSPWVEAVNVHRILDLCTGSGCIAIACAYAFADAQVDAADISADALEVTEHNIEQHDLQDRVQAIESDLFQQLQGQRYDIIVSNPPYVSMTEMQGLPAEYRHEPRLGLEAGSEGLDIVHRILRDAAGHLNDNGILIVEVGNSQSALVQAYPQVPFMWLEFSRGGEGVFLLTAEQLSRVPR
jgi:ribosomal protein L3 glutamine methyltransferase